MSLSHCTGGINGVGMGLSRVRVELLTPVTAACFDVYFNVVLCCSLFVYILIKKKHNKLYFTPSDARGIKSFLPKAQKTENCIASLSLIFSCSRSCRLHWRCLSTKHPAVASPSSSCCAMIHLSVTAESRRCPEEQHKAVKFCLSEPSLRKSPVL